MTAPFFPNSPYNCQKGQPPHNSAFGRPWIEFPFLKEVIDILRHQPATTKATDNGIPNLLRHFATQQLWSTISSVAKHRGLYGKLSFYAFTDYP